MRTTLLAFVLLGLLGCAGSTSSGSNKSGAAMKTATKADAQAFIDQANEESAELGLKIARAEWLRQTHITADTIALAAAAGEEGLAFSSRLVEQSKRFSHLNLD